MCLQHTTCYWPPSGSSHSETNPPAAAVFSDTKESTVLRKRSATWLICKGTSHRYLPWSINKQPKQSTRSCINNQDMHFEGQALKPQLHQYCISKSRAHYFYKSPIKRYNMPLLFPLYYLAPQASSLTSLSISFPNCSLPGAHQRIFYLGKQAYLPSNTSHSFISKSTIFHTNLDSSCPSFSTLPSETAILM